MSEPRTARPSEDPSPPEQPSRLAVVPGRDDVAALRTAIDDDQLVLHYHPVVDLQTDLVVGVEGLVRWRHPARGLLPPVAFVSLAEESGLIVALGEWVLQEGARAAARWALAGHTLDVALNLSPLQMSDPGFAARVLEVLEAVRAPLDRIVLEVTESALMDQPHAAAVLEVLHRAGLRLALDDFGTGYSSFPYLRRFPIDVIKVDRSFVAGLGAHADDEAIVASIVGLARDTGKTVVAEGVEQPVHAEVLRALGARFAQGFLWSRPLPEDQVVPWVLARTASRRLRTVTPLPAAPEAQAVIVGMHQAGASSHTIAAALNAQGRRTVAGTRWHPRSVALVLDGAGRG